MNDWIAIGALAVIGLVIPLGMMTVSALIRPSVPSKGKSAVYESGEVPTGSARLRFNIQYYMVALLFVVFDVETVMLLPWVVVYRPALEQGVQMATLLGPMLAFVGIWRSGWCGRGEIML
jgi:NADH:ubiquinone oxidoreductase subunit 3 (chain A)